MAAVGAAAVGVARCAGRHAARGDAEQLHRIEEGHLELRSLRRDVQVLRQELARGQMGHAFSLQAWLAETEDGGAIQEACLRAVRRELKQFKAALPDIPRGYGHGRAAGGSPAALVRGLQELEVLGNKRHKETVKRQKEMKLDLADFKRAMAGKGEAIEEVLRDVRAVSMASEAVAAFQETQSRQFRAELEGMKASVDTLHQAVREALAEALQRFAELEKKVDAMAASA